MGLNIRSISTSEESRILLDLNRRMKCIAHSAYITANNTSSPVGVFPTSVIVMMDDTGALVIRTLYSDGSILYTNQDGTPYLGDTTLL